MRLFKKFIELFAGEMILSLAVSMLIQSIEIFNERRWGFTAVLIFTILICFFFFLNCQRTLFDEFLRSGEIRNKKYFALIGIPLAVMTVLAVTLAYFNAEPAYTYMLLPFKLFAICGVYKPLAAVLTGVLLTVPMFAAYFVRPDVEEFEDE